VSRVPVRRKIGTSDSHSAPCVRFYADRIAVDVLTETQISRPRAEVGGDGGAPHHPPSWDAHIRSVEWQTPRPAAVGSRIAFVASFLGRRLAYTYEIVELVAGERLVMRTEQGPFPMETTYTWEDTSSGATRMTLRNHGEPSGFRGVAGPWMAAAVRRANRRDLARLKSRLEGSQPSADR
jgi:hypothetical protein